jgi:hypothetical protein
VARLVNNAYRVLEAVHTSPSLSQRADSVNIAGPGAPPGAISLAPAVEVLPAAGTRLPKDTP